MTERSECIFCRIADGVLNTELVREDELTVAFHDTDPKAPLHVLVIPRRHIASLNDIAEADSAVLSALFYAARDVAAAAEIAEGGYRLVLNTGTAAGQSVHHIHLHVLGGRELTWPPG